MYLLQENNNIASLAELSCRQPAGEVHKAAHSKELARRWRERGKLLSDKGFMSANTQFLLGTKIIMPAEPFLTPPA